jgi:hypothetical protein
MRRLAFLPIVSEEKNSSMEVGFTGLLRPIMFSLMGIACVGIAASTCIGIAASWVIGAALWLGCAVVVWFVEYKKIARQGAIEPA